MTEILGVVEGNKVNKQTLAATTLAVGATSAAGSVASRPQISRWYSRVRKPSYVPPNKVFPIVWTSLYADIAVTSATAIDRFREQGRNDEARKYTVALAANLILNGAWSWLFFKYRKLGASAIGAGLLAASSADLVKRTAAADPRAGAALAPYPLWCSFATLMSGHIWVLNRR